MSSPDGIQLIAAERQRQIVDEGWAPEHDAHHAADELATAAAAYAQRPDRRSLIRLIQDPADGGWYYDNAHTRSTCGPRCTCAKRGIPDDAPKKDVPEDWPFDPSWWKPSEDRVRDLVKAGALIAAEIDRLLLASGRDPEVPRG
jgi:hypothetical protein